MLLLLRIIMWPFSQLLNILFTLTGSYGMAIILFAVVIKLLMLYPSAKSKRNMMHMARMNPKMQEIKKRCGNNQEKYALEIQKLYQEEHVNPMGGCLWSLLPLPILLALYNVIRRPVINFMLINMSRPDALETLEVIREKLTALGYQITGNAAYEEISIAKGITEHLSEVQAVVPQVFPIDFNFLGVDLTAIPTQVFGQFMSGSFSLQMLVLVLIPVVSGLLNLLLMVISQRSAVTTDDAMKTQQTMMMVMMPLMSAYIGFILPASLGVYWISSTTTRSWTAKKPPARKLPVRTASAAWRPPRTGPRTAPRAISAKKSRSAWRTRTTTAIPRRKRTAPPRPAAWATVPMPGAVPSPAAITMTCPTRCTATRRNSKELAA